MHNIEQFCDKIDSIKKMADDLRKTPPTSLEIRNKIEVIQLDCSLVAKGEVEGKEIEDEGTRRGKETAEYLKSKGFMGGVNDKKDNTD